MTIIIMAQYMNYPDFEQERLLPQTTQSVNQIAFPLNQSEYIPEPMKQIKTETPERQQIIHTVAYGDTLEGLSLQYGVSPFKIKLRNKLDGGQIYMRKTLVIPDPNEIIQKVDVDDQKQDRRRCILASFRNQMDSTEKSDKTALYYLQLTDWDITEALKQYKEDLAFEKKNPNKQTTHPDLIKMQKALYNKNHMGIELKEKKRQ